MRSLLIGFVFLSTFSCAKQQMPKQDWAIVVVREIGSATNWIGHIEWTVAKVVKANRSDLVGCIIRIHTTAGSQGDTVKVFRVPLSNCWDITPQY